VAARNAINSPLLEVSIHGAKGVLFSIAGGEDLGMLEVQDAANVITEAIDPDAKVIFGAVTDSSLKKGEVRVTVIATGFPELPPRSTLFAASSRIAARKDSEVPPVTSAPDFREKEGEREAGKADEESRASAKTEKDKGGKAPAKSTEIHSAAIKHEEDDSWGGLPSFLRKK